MNFDADLTACAALVERGDPQRFRAAMAAPVAARKVLFALYAFNVEVARAPWVTQEPMIAEMRLQWWRDVCEEIARGGPVRRHEVATPLASILAPEQAHLLDELVAARRWDIYKDSFEDIAHFDRYLDQTAGHLMWIAAATLGKAEESVVRDAGFAAGLVAFLRAIPALEAAGRVPLLDGTEAGVSALAAQGLQRLGKARANRKGISIKARPALLPLAGAGAVLRVARDQPWRVAEGSLPDARLRLPLRALTGRW